MCCDSSLVRRVCFGQYTETLDVIQEYVNYRKWKFLRLDGATNRVTRELEVRAFNAPDSPYFIYLISTRAGGQGINLASADSVVLYDSCYNPQVDLQVSWRFQPPNPYREWPSTLVDSAPCLYCLWRPIQPSLPHEGLPARPRTAPTASGRRSRSWSTASCARARWRRTFCACRSGRC